MKKSPEKLSKRPPKGGWICTVDVNGKVSDGAIHDQIMKHVDDSQLRKASYEMAKAAGASPEMLKLLE